MMIKDFPVQKSMSSRYGSIVESNWRPPIGSSKSCMSHWSVKSKPPEVPDILLQATMFGATVIGLRLATIIALSSFSIQTIQTVLSLVFTALIAYHKSITTTLQPGEANYPQSMLNFTEPFQQQSLTTMETSRIDNLTVPSITVEKPVLKNPKEKLNHQENALLDENGPKDKVDDKSVELNQTVHQKEEKSMVDNETVALEEETGNTTAPTHLNASGTGYGSFAESNVWQYVLPEHELDQTGTVGSKSLSSSQMANFKVNKRMIRAFFIAVFAIWMYIEMSRSND